nr:MAG TPA: hypothetical protein [Caudoviricetes sp.]
MILWKSSRRFQDTADILHYLLLGHLETGVLFHYKESGAEK